MLDCASILCVAVPTGQYKGLICIYDFRLITQLWPAATWTGQRPPSGGRGPSWRGTSQGSPPRRADRKVNFEHDKEFYKDRKEVSSAIVIDFC